MLAVALITGGAAMMVLFEHHSLSLIWTDPFSIFWSSEPLRAGPFWWIGPMLMFAGAAVIAEDYFGFGRTTPERYSRDSALRAETQPTLPGYGRDRPEPPPATISRL